MTFFFVETIYLGIPVTRGKFANKKGMGFYVANSELTSEGKRNAIFIPSPVCVSRSLVDARTKDAAGVRGRQE